MSLEFVAKLKSVAVRQQTLIIQMNEKKNKILFFAVILCLYSFSNSPLYPEQKAPFKNIRKGVWITVFSENKVLYSKESVKILIEFCNATNIKEIYLQLYRNGEPYFDSTIGSRARYEEIINSAGIDTIDFLLNEAKKNGIQVFAWINVLSAGTNKESDIVKKYGESVLTKDQYLRTSIKSDKKDESDKYYLREDQIFLEPGDLRVLDYVLSIVNSLITRYPGLSGIHLDYIRYPNPLPYIPDSRFNKYGLSYGYGDESLKRFKARTGLDPLNMETNRDNCLIWDNWKREQVTNLVNKICDLVKSKSSKYLISCAVLPSFDRAYSFIFQDWPLWLEKKYADYVVLMNYTVDNKYGLNIAKSSLPQRGQGKIYIGIGAFLLKYNAKLFLEQYESLCRLKPDGIVFFSYDDIKDKSLNQYL